MASPDWNLYRTLLAVLREGSLSRAARKLHLSQPTVGRHIDELEERLGTSLFARSPSGLVPTPSALTLMTHAKAMESAAEALTRTASGGLNELRGSVRLTASEFVGTLVLPPILAKLRELFPKIAVELSVSNCNQDLLQREADIAVRMAPPKQHALIQRKIGLVQIGLYANRSYLERHGMPRELIDLLGHPIIGFDRDHDSVRAFMQMRLPVTRDLFSLRSDSDPVRFHMLLAGFGVGTCQVGLAARFPELVRILPHTFGFELGMWLVMHEDLRSSRRTRVFFGHLAQALSEYVAEGRSSKGIEATRTVGKLRPVSPKVRTR